MIAFPLSEVTGPTHTLWTVSLLAQGCTRVSLNATSDGRRLLAM